jgi:hypothetical protein
VFVAFITFWFNSRVAVICASIRCARLESGALLRAFGPVRFGKFVVNHLCRRRREISNFIHTEPRVGKMGALPARVGGLQARGG